MKNTALTLLILTLFSCSSILDHPVNKEDFSKVKETLKNDDSYTDMKRKYVIDHLSMMLGFAELGKAIESNKAELPTFREYISELSTDYDSIRAAKLMIVENNKKLKSFMELVDAKTTGIDEYRGYLTMKLKFSNEFDKDVLYAILNYKYVDKYDTEHFNEKSKLTDEVANKFQGEVEITTKGEYNQLAKFIYSKVPVRANKQLREELGEEAANRKVERDFLMSGLKVELMGIVFTDKTELFYQDEEWEYL